jgi:hypothetical protein
MDLTPQHYDGGRAAFMQRDTSDSSRWVYNLKALVDATITPC